MLARLALILAATLLLCGVTRTAEPPQEALGELLDMQLAKAILRALQKDKELATYRLEVEVKRQVAHLKGLVPNREYAERAVARVKHSFPQLKEVVSELTFSGTIVLKPSLTEPTPSPENPSSEAKASSEAKVGPIRIREGGAAPQATTDGAKPATSPDLSSRPVQQATPTHRDLLAERVTAIQRNSSFAKVRVEIQGRLVKVYRPDSMPELADILAQRLRDLPGVEGVEIVPSHSR